MRDRDENTDITITFTDKPSTYSGRQRSCNIIKERLGLRRIAKNCKTELECLKLFITEEILSVIAENTNIVIVDILQVCQILKVSIFETKYTRRDFRTSWTYLLLWTLQSYKHFH